MIALLFLLGILALLFMMSYMTHRRFGMLGLGLAAGALLSANWVGTLTPFIEQQGVVLRSPPLTVVVGATLILLPAAALLFSGPVYHGRWAQIGGAAAFAVFGFVLLSVPLAGALALDGPSLSLMQFVQKYNSILIILGVIGAVTDVLLASNSKQKKREH